MASLLHLEAYGLVTDLFDGTDKRTFARRARWFRRPRRYSKFPDLLEAQVEHERVLYSIIYAGPKGLEFLTRIIERSGTLIRRVRLSPFAAHVWANSSFIGAGMSACVRFMDEPSTFPVVKLSHHTILDADDESHQGYQGWTPEVYKSIIKYEFDLLSEMQPLGLPVPKINSQPLVEDGQVCGFRMERLHPIPDDPNNPGEIRHPSDRFFKGETRLKAWVTRKEDSESALAQIHQAGYCHNDLASVHAMLNTDSQIVFIDFGMGGRIGHPVPRWFPPFFPRHKAPFFNTELDLPLFTARELESAAAPPKWIKRNTLQPLGQ